MTDERLQAERFAELFRAVYLTFHRRDGPRSQLPGASRAVLEHLATPRAPTAAPVPAQTPTAEPPVPRE